MEEEIYESKTLVAYAKEKMPSEELISNLSDFFKNFGDSTRLKIVSALMSGELCVADICEVLEMSTSAVSHQLRILRQAKMVRSRRDGKQVYYSIDDNHVGILYSVGLAHLNEENKEENKKEEV
ncbi:MAG: ArsR/SmtB family transcription factor [Treponema sp.]